MARTRLNLHQKLCDILGSDAVYFKKPSNGMVYPCILYDLQGEDIAHADNQRWVGHLTWTITVVDENADSPIPFCLRSSLDYCSFDRFYMADGLNHFVHTLYY